MPDTTVPTATAAKTLEHDHSHSHSQGHVHVHGDACGCDHDHHHHHHGAPQTPIRVMKVGRNDPCPCGSGKKYKKCCLA